MADRIKADVLIAGGGMVGLTLAVALARAGLRVLVADRGELLTQQLDAISKYIPPSIGQMFFAIGIKFNSFKLIDSFVLLAISFGNHIEIDVLGQSNIVVPSEVPPGE